MRPDLRFSNGLRHASVIMKSITEVPRKAPGFGLPEMPSDRPRSRAAKGEGSGVPVCPLLGRLAGLRGISSAGRRKSEHPRSLPVNTTGQGSGKQKAKFLFSRRIGSRPAGATVLERQVHCDFPGRCRVGEGLGIRGGLGRIVVPDQARQRRNLTIRKQECCGLSGL